MPILKFAKKAALVGLGLSERVIDVVSELEKKGEESQSKDALRLREFIESLEKREQKFRQKKEALCTKLSEKIQICKPGDLARLEKKVSDLAERFRQWEATAESKNRPTS